MPTINWPWAIVLCRFNDVSAVPQNADYYEDLYTRNGTGGLCDYWRTVSCNSLDLTGSRVFGWFTMNHASSEVNRLRFPGDRSTLVQWGLDTAAARCSTLRLSPRRNLNSPDPRGTLPRGKRPSSFSDSNFASRLRSLPRNSGWRFSTRLANWSTTAASSRAPNSRGRCGT